MVREPLLVCAPQARERNLNRIGEVRAGNLQPRRKRMHGLVHRPDGAGIIRQLQNGAGLQAVRIF